MSALTPSRDYDCLSVNDSTVEQWLDTPWCDQRWFEVMRSREVDSQMLIEVMRSREVDSQRLFEVMRSREVDYTSLKL